MAIISTDPVADMLTRIRNAIAVRKHQVSMPHSKFKLAIAELLQSNGFVNSVEVVNDEVGKLLVIEISTPDSNAKISEIKRLSTPGRRVYVNSKEIPTVKHGRGIVVVSTPKGLLTGKEAKAQGVGGELVCTVY